MYHIIPAYFLDFNSEYQNLYRKKKCLKEGQLSKSGYKITKADIIDVIIIVKKGIERI
jgi:hypothetical protein